MRPSPFRPPRRLLLWPVVALGLVGCRLPVTDAAAQDIRVQGDDPGLAHLAAEVARLAEQAEGRVGVAAYHLGTGRGITLNGDERFPMASTYKVPIAVQILSMVDRGELGLHDLIEIERSDVYVTSGSISDLLDDPGLQISVHNLLELMLQISDNIATDVLMKTAGGSQAVTDRIRDAGIEAIRVDRPTWAIIANWLGAAEVSEDNKIDPEDYEVVLGAARTDAGVAADNANFNSDPRDTATPAAMSMLLQQIWNREILSEESSALLVDIMYRCRTGEGRLKGVLPAGTRVAHKTGTIGQTTWSCPGFVDTSNLRGKEDSTMPKKRLRYPPEFRREMVGLVRSGRSPESLAREFEPSSGAIRNWVRQADLDEGRRADGLTTKEREEVRRLRREVRRLRMERDILKKAAAWFAMESGSIPGRGSSS